LSAYISHQYNSDRRVRLLCDCQQMQNARFKMFVPIIDDDDGDRNCIQYSHSPEGDTVAALGDMAL